MTDFITVTGTIGTAPEHKVVGDRLSRTTFRLACSERRRSADGQTWEDTHTNWYSVTCFGRLATNVIASLEKGQRVILSGKLRIRNYTRDDKSQGTQVEIVASSVGHDLSVQIATAAKRTGGERVEESSDQAATTHEPAQVAGAEYPTPSDWGSGIAAAGELDTTEPGGLSVSVDPQTGEVAPVPF